LIEVIILSETEDTDPGNVERFNELLDLAISKWPEDQRYCVKRETNVPIQKLTDFDCTKCEFFILSDSDKAICDPL
jgi:hypothetical protein